tara:strand:+ start:6726 stop:6908 length:183 start_codon:yes stop_codon:yes gene_type:complete
MSSKAKPIDELILIINQLKQDIFILAEDVKYIKSKFEAIDEFINIEEPVAESKASFYSFW